MKIQNKPIISVPSGASNNFIPDYALREETFEISSARYIYYKFLLWCIRIVARIRLWYFGPQQDADPDNTLVEKIYHREAQTYERKHHRTTNFRDTWWRRHLGMDVVGYWMRMRSGGAGIVKILDLATGVGLSAEEMMRVCLASEIF